MKARQPWLLSGGLDLPFQQQMKRQHPFVIVQAFSKYLLLLLFPLLRTAVGFLRDWRSWLSGAWMDLLVIGLIVLFGFAQWYFTGYLLEKDGILFRRGVIFPMAQKIPYRMLSSIAVEHPFYLRPFGIVKLAIETDAGSKLSAEATFLLRRSEAERITEAASAYFKEDTAPPRVYLPKSGYVAILSFLTSNTLTGVLFASTFLTQTGRLLGEEFELRLVGALTKLAQILAFNLPPIFAVIGGVVLGGWLLSFFLNLIRNLGFRMRRSGDVLDAKMGLVSPKEFALAAGRINYLTLRQSLLTKGLGFYAAMINCTGYGKDKNDLAVLLPASAEQDLRRTLRLLLPEMKLAPRKYHPNWRSFTRFVIPPGTTLLLIFAGFGLLYYWLPDFHRLVGFFWIACSLPAFWWLFVKILAFFHSGISVREDVYTFRHTFAYAVYTTVVHKNKIAKIELRQSLFQRMSHCADVIVFTFSERRHRFVVQNIPIDQAEEFFRIFGK